MINIQCFVINILCCNLASRCWWNK